MKDFVDQHRDAFEIEPIFKVLQIAPTGFRRYAVQRRAPSLRSQRIHREEALMPEIQGAWQENMQVYGAKNGWRQLEREQVTVARCRVDRLMRRLGLHGVHRGKNVKTITPDPALPCQLKRVNGQFRADRPNQLWVSDFTYISNWQAWVNVAFVVDVFARRIVDGQLSSSMRTDFMLDGLEQVLSDHQPERAALTHRSSRDNNACSDPSETLLLQKRRRTITFDLTSKPS